MNRRSMLAALACGCIAPPAWPLVAGDPPDSPALHVDPNVPTSRWACVGSVLTGQGIYSGVLVHRRFALTAGHVAPRDPAAVSFQLNLQSDRPTVLAVRRVVHHPAYRGFSPQNPTFDLAVLELAEPAPARVSVHPVAEVEPVAGMPMVIVGYGAAGHGASGATIPPQANVKRAGSAVVDRLVRDPGDVERALLYMFTFQRAGAARKPPTGITAPVGLAGGDSGSAAFIRAKGRFGLFGINTFTRLAPDGARFGFGTVGGGQVLSFHLAWLRAIISA